MTDPIIYGGGRAGLSAYELYIQVTEGNGDQPLSLEDWLLSLQAQSYSNRAALVAAVEGGTLSSDGTVVSDGTVLYVWDSGSTAISDLPGLAPFGEVFVEHFHPGGADYTASFQSAFSTYNAVSTFDQAYNVTALPEIGEGKTLIGPGRVLPSAEFQTREYSNTLRAGVKSPFTNPVSSKLGLVIGGQSDGEGMGLKAQSNFSMDLIPSRDFNPTEIQLYSNKCTGVVTTDGSDIVTYVRGFGGDFSSGFYPGDQFWVKGVQYTIAEIVDPLSIRLTTTAPADFGGSAAHILYSTFDCVVNISGTLVTLVSGDYFFAAGDDNIVINGQRISGTVTSITTMTLDVPLLDESNVSVLYRTVTNEDFVQILRLQNLRGQGSEQTFSFATTPYQCRIRVGSTSDGVAEYLPLRIEGAAPVDDPFPNNPGPQTWAYWDKSGNMGLRNENPEANLHLSRDFNSAQGDDNFSSILLRLESKWNGVASTRRSLDIVARNNFDACQIQGRSGATLSLTADVVMQPEGGRLVMGDRAGAPSGAALYVNKPGGGDVVLANGTYRIGVNQVVGPRISTWSPLNGVAARSTFDTEDPGLTLVQVARAVKALRDDLGTHGLINP